MYTCPIAKGFLDRAISLYRGLDLGPNTGCSKKTDGIWNRYNLKSTRRIYKFGVLKCSEKLKVLDLCKLIILN